MILSDEAFDNLQFEEDVPNTDLNTILQGMTVIGAEPVVPGGAVLYFTAPSGGMVALEIIRGDEDGEVLFFLEDCTSHSPAWNLEMLYRLEPQLREIEARAKQDSDPFSAYEQAKRSASRLVGYSAANPHLRSSKAWACFFRHLVEELDL